MQRETFQEAAKRMNNGAMVGGKEVAMSSVYRGFTVLLASAVLCVGIGCKQEGPAEKAGKKVDEAVEKAGQTMQEGKEKVEAAAEKAAEKAQEGAEQVKETAQEAVEKAKEATK
ncbi:MAG: hypothetical protein AB1555_06760 [Nitrospirota bacterium]